MQAAKISTAPETIAGTRPTALYVVLYAVVLQSTMSLISLASFGGFFWRESLYSRRRTPCSSGPPGSLQLFGRLFRSSRQSRCFVGGRAREPSTPALEWRR
jgi:hypothetical protein